MDLIYNFILSFEYFSAIAIGIANITNIFILKVRYDRICNRSLIAAGANNTEIIQTLIDHNAELDKLNEFGKTPLAIASDNGNIETVNLLLQRKAKVNHKGKYSRPPLIFAIIKDRADIAKALLENGADPDIKVISRIHTTDNLYKARIPGYCQAVNRKECKCQSRVPQGRYTFDGGSHAQPYPNR